MGVLYSKIAKTSNFPLLLDIQRELTYVPGLYKIFDEILVNAADNKVRDPNMSCIKITINPEANEIKVWNNGKGIPVVHHKDENVRNAKLYVSLRIILNDSLALDPWCPFVNVFCAVLIGQAL